MLTANESKEIPPLSLYQERLLKYKEESRELSALEKHVFLFLDKNKTFSPSTIAAELSKMHSSASSIKGFMIALFNASHAKTGICPALHGQFANNFALALHLGTTRIWNPDGSINEQNWQKFKTYIAQVQNNDSTYLAKSTLHSYLTKCYNEDKPENTTGRNANAFFAVGKIQAMAAVAAWDEVFDRLAGCWKTDSNGKIEPCLTIEDTRMFFEDSPLVFLKAEFGLLPVLKPQIEKLPKTMTCI